jgi:hypothetical protein
MKQATKYGLPREALMKFMLADGQPPTRGTTWRTASSTP